jgi:uncharacterized protein YdcH (DUF465 family)
MNTMKEAAIERGKQLIEERKKLQDMIHRAEIEEVEEGTLVVELFEDLEHLKSLYEKNRKLSKEIRKVESITGPIGTQP